MKSKQKCYRLLINPRMVSRGDSRGTFNVYVVELQHNKGVRRVRGVGSDSAFDNMAFHVQWDTEGCHSTPLEHTYGWQVRYRDVYSVDLSDAERMVQTLRKAAKAYAALTVKPVTFGQYVAMLANALGIHGALTESKQGNGSHYYDDNIYLEHNLADAAEIIDRVILQARSPEVAL